MFVHVSGRQLCTCCLRLQCHTRYILAYCVAVGAKALRRSCPSLAAQCQHKQYEQYLSRTLVALIELADTCKLHAELRTQFVFW
jgi:hypothetical protein